MKTLQLPRMSTDKPHYLEKHSYNGDFTNHLHQEFNQKAPNLVWTSDFTYSKVNGKWYYLCIVMDLFSRKVISWHISGKPDVALIITTFRKAYGKRNMPSGLMFHSGRGTQYTAFAFRSLKEEINRSIYHSLQELQFSVFEYIEGFYNSKRPHGSLGMMTPNEKEELYWGQY